MKLLYDYVVCLELVERCKSSYMCLIDAHCLYKLLFKNGNDENPPAQNDNVKSLFMLQNYTCSTETLKWQEFKNKFNLQYPIVFSKLFTPSKNSSFTISLLTLQIVKYINQDARSFREKRQKLHDRIDQNMENIQGGNAASQLSQHTIAADHTVNISKTSFDLSREENMVCKLK